MGRQSRVKKQRRNDGRHFERLVTRIERTVAESGARVEHNQTIIDKDTGEERQIDVLIRRGTGAEERIAIVECRDREGMQDVRWIEELYGKQRSVGAHVVIGVTSGPISAPAMKKAKAWGIQIRSVRDLEPNEVLALFETGVPGLKLCVNDIGVAFCGDHGPGVTGISVDWGDGPSTPAAATKTLIALLKDDLMGTPFLFDDDQWTSGISMATLLEEARQQGWDPVRGRAVGEQVTTVLPIEFTDVYAPVDGRRQVRAIQIRYETARIVHAADHARLAYDGLPDATKIVAVDWVTPDKKSEFKVTLAVDRRGIRANVQRAEPTKPRARSKRAGERGTTPTS